MPETCDNRTSAKQPVIDASRGAPGEVSDVRAHLFHAEELTQAGNPSVMSISGKHTVEHTPREAIPADGAGLAHDPGHAEAKESSSADMIVFLHVWDALLPISHSHSAPYLAVRMRRPGFGVQQASTKPAHPRAWLPADGYTYTGDEKQPNKTTLSSNDQLKRAYVRWDEHFVFSMNDEECLLELQVLDARVELDQASRELATSTPESFPSFRRRGSSNEDGRCHHGRWETPRLPAPVLYRLNSRSEREGEADESDSTFSECCLENPQQVDVRITSLVLRPGEELSHADEVKVFHQRKIEPYRSSANPKCRRYLRKPLPVLASPRALQSAHTCHGAPAVGRNHNVMDIDGARRLFLHYAEVTDVNDSGSIATEASQAAVLLSRLSHSEICTSSVGLEPNSASDHHMDHVPCTRWMLTREKFLELIHKHFLELRNSSSMVFPLESAEKTRSYFPGNAKVVGDARAEDAGGRDYEARALSFTEFISWLNNLPVSALAEANLVVSPRAALARTEAVMDASTKKVLELKTTFRDPRWQPSLPGDAWRTLSLLSIRAEAVAERVEMGAEKWTVPPHKPAFAPWHRHVEMLTRDVNHIDGILASLEDEACTKQLLNNAHAECCPRTAALDGVDELSSCETRGNSPTFIRDGNEAEVERSLSSRTTLTEGSWNVGVGTANPTAVDPALVYARLINDGAKQLAHSAEHLKEMLRRSGDVLCRDSYGLAEALAFEINPESIAAYSLAMPKRSKGGKESLCSPRRAYEDLLLKIKQVKELQADITRLKRRASAIVRKRRQSSWKRTSSCGGSYYNRGCADAVHRPKRSSPMFLVKRIRESYAVIQASVATGSDHRCGSGPATDPQCLPRDVQLESPRLSTLRVRQGQGVTPAIMIKGEDESQESSTDPARGHDTNDRELLMNTRGTAELCPVTSAGGVPDRDRLKSLSLHGIKKRLEELRKTFRGAAIDLPVALKGATAEQIIDLCDPGSYSSYQDMDDRKAFVKSSTTAMSCAIDRQSYEH